MRIFLIFQIFKEFDNLQIMESNPEHNTHAAEETRTRLPDLIDALQEPCPFNNSHIITLSEMPLHLQKCNYRRNSAKKYTICKFNPHHIVKSSEIESHESKCEDRQNCSENNKSISIQNQEKKICIDELRIVDDNLTMDINAIINKLHQQTLKGNKKYFKKYMIPPMPKGDLTLDDFPTKLSDSD